MTAAFAAPRVGATADLDELQGAWITAAGRRHATLLVAGTRYAVEFHDGDIYIGTFTLDPHDEPRRMDMRIDEGPPRHRGRTAYCIYKFEGPALHWCPSPPGSPNRLYKFPTADDARYLSLVFRPVRPRKGG
jgi:uncharacterized protein (TIGR03067 family)